MAKIRKPSKKKKETDQSHTKGKSKEFPLMEREDPYSSLQGEELAAARRIGWDKSADKE